MSAARQTDNRITVSTMLSAPSVWAWLWTTLFSRIEDTGFAFGDLLEDDEVARIIDMAPGAIGPTRSAEANEMFFSSGRISLWLGRMEGEWRSLLVLDHVDEVDRLPNSFLRELQVPARRIELVRDKLSH